MEFLKTWYRTLIRQEQLLEVLEAWLSAHPDWKDGVPSLIFTRPNHDWTPFFPKRSIEIVSVTKNADTTQLAVRFEVENNISDPWRERIQASELPKVVSDFLRINSEEDKIYTDLGPNLNWWERLPR